MSAPVERKPKEAEPAKPEDNPPKPAGDKPEEKKVEVLKAPEPHRDLLKAFNTDILSDIEVTDSVSGKPYK